MRGIWLIVLAACAAARFERPSPSPAAPQEHAAELVTLPEFLRPDPFGGVVGADGGRAAPQPERRDVGRPLALRAARGGYASFHLVVKLARPGPYQLALELEDPGRRLAVDLFREWFH